MAHFEIHATDVERAKAFYREAFGWELAPFGETYLVHWSEGRLGIGFGAGLKEELSDSLFYVSVPDEIVKAARIDGAGFFKIFFRVILPISAPIIVVTVIWQFTNIWNDFLFGSSFSFGESAPVQVALNNMVLTSTSVKQYNVDMAAAFIAAFPTIVVYVLAGKYFIRGLTAGSVKG